MALASVCIFCGASTGNHPAYREAAQALGRALPERKLTLVYGGGAVGLIAIVADAALAAGGAVIGIIPPNLTDTQLGTSGLPRLQVVEDRQRDAQGQRVSVRLDLGGPRT